MWRSWNPHILLVAQPLWKVVWQFLSKLNIKLPYGLAILLFCIYLIKMETYVCMKTCTIMFIDFICNLLKQAKPKFPLARELTNKL